MPWPVVVDDDGSKTSGTVWSKAIHDAIKTYYDSLIVSGANPAVFPNAVTDEVVAARAAFGSLDLRLDDIEGKLPPAGTATLDDVKRQQAQKQLIRNNDLSQWGAGASAAPDYFVLSGAGAAVVRTGSGEADTTTLGVGTYAAKVTSAVGAEAQLIQTVFSAADVTAKPQLLSRKVVLTARVKCSSANAAKLVVNDGVTTSSSSFHTGDGTVQQLSVVHTISGAGTKLEVYLSVALGTLSAHVGGFNVNFSDNAQALWIPDTDVWGSRYSVTLARFGSTLVGNSLAAETDVFPLPGGIPANAVRVDGQTIEVNASGTLANNANNKIVRLYIGTAYITLIATPAAVANNVFTVHVRVTRFSSSTAELHGYVTYGAATGAAPTVNHFRQSSWSGGGIDWTANQVMKMTLWGSADNDLQMRPAIYQFHP